MTRRTEPTKKFAKFGAPKFKTVVATLERERDLLGLVGLLDVFLLTDEVYTALAAQPRFGEGICRSFLDGEFSRFGRRTLALAEAIERCPIESELDRGSALHALLKHASYLGDDLEEIEAIVERVKQKPITPKQQAA
jgi:hypothetical protein